MRDEDKTKGQLIEELKALRRELSVLKLQIASMVHPDLARVTKQECSSEPAAECQILLDSITQGLSLVSSDFDILWANDVMRKVFKGNLPDLPDLVGHSFKELFDEEHAFMAFRENAHKHVYETGVFSNEEKLKRSDGTTFHAYLGVAQIEPESTSETFVIAFCDVTARNHADYELSLYKDVFGSAISNARICPYRLNFTKKTYDFLGENFEEITGISRDPGTFKNLREAIQEIIVTDPDSPTRPMEYFKAFEEGRAKRYRADIRIKTPDGKIRWISDSSLPLIDDKTGQLIGSLGILSDITERKQIEEHLRELSVIDELTGLYNRRGFITLVEQQIKIANRTGEKMSLFFLDLDDMKWINDTFGHQTGDQALKDLAGILNKSFRESDIIARIGGDEFVTLAIQTPTEITDTMLARLHDYLEKHNVTEQRPYRLAISVGIARYDPEIPCTIDDLLAHADALMYQNKRNKIK